MADVEVHEGVEEEEGGVQGVSEGIVAEVEGTQAVPRLYYHPVEGGGGRERGRGGRSEL